MRILLPCDYKGQDLGFYQKDIVTRDPISQNESPVQHGPKYVMVRGLKLKDQTSQALGEIKENITSTSSHFAEVVEERKYISNLPFNQV